MPAAKPVQARGIDRALETGVAAVLVLAPLPFGAVTTGGRLALEIASFLLLLVWAGAAWTGPVTFPPKRVLGLLGGLLLLGTIQMLPLGHGPLRFVSAHSLTVRESVAPSGADLAAEERLLQRSASSLDPAATLSVEPGASASALRTGVALCALLVVATHVGATRGARGLPRRCCSRRRSRRFMDSSFWRPGTTASGTP